MSAGRIAALRDADACIAHFNRDFVAKQPQRPSNSNVGHDDDDTFEVVSFDPKDFATRPLYAREEIVDWACRGEVTMIVSQPSVGPPALCLLLALAIVANRPDIIGEKELSYTGDVYYVCGERGDALDRRWEALLDQHGLREAELPHHLHIIKARPGKVFKFLRSEGIRGGNVDLTKQGAKIVDRIKANGNVAAIILDTAASLFEVSENDNGDMGAAYSLLNSIAAQTEAAVLISHHMTKAAGDGSAGDLMAARGGSAAPAAVSTSVNLTKLGKDAPLPPHIRDRTIQMAFTKTSETGSGSRRRYFRKSGHRIRTVDKRDGTPRPTTAVVPTPENITMGWGDPASEANLHNVLVAVQDAGAKGSPYRVRGAKVGPSGAAELAKQFEAEADDVQGTFNVLYGDKLIGQEQSEPSGKNGRTHKVWIITAAGELAIQAGLERRAVADAASEDEAAD
jgi:hypothetical protein